MTDALIQQVEDICGGYSTAVVYALWLKTQLPTTAEEILGLLYVALRDLRNSTPESYEIPAIEKGIALLEARGIKPVTYEVPW